MDFVLEISISATLPSMLMNDPLAFPQGDNFMGRLAVGVIAFGLVSGVLVGQPVAMRDGRDAEREVRATERRVTKVTVLRPSAGTEVQANVQKLSWSDQTETVAFAPLPAVPERANARKTTAFKINDDGTYTASRAATPASVATLGSIGICDPAIETTCGGTGGGGGSDTGVGHFIEAVETLSANGVLLRTRASLGVTPCKGNAVNGVRVDSANGACLAGQGWVTTGCTASHTPIGSIGSSASNTVTAQYTASTGMALTNRVAVASDGSGMMASSANEVITSTYPSPLCGDTAQGPAPPGGGGEDNAGKGETYCAPVYDGSTGQYLGSCCGTTSAAIIKCAAQFL
jgi:hypothetical protein